MQLTSLEITLATGMSVLISSGATGTIVRYVMGRKYVRKESCRNHHKAESDQEKFVRKQQSQDMKELKDSINTLFQMNRALVTYSDIPMQEKTKILNSPGNNRE